MHRSPECAKEDTVSRLSTSVLNIHISCSISVKKNILHSCILSCCNNFVLVWHINKILLIVSIWCELHVILMHATFHHWITLFHLHKYIKLTNTNCAKLNFHSLKLQYTHPFYFLYFKHYKYKIIYVYRFFLYRHLFM